MPSTWCPNTVSSCAWRAEGAAGAFPYMLACKEKFAQAFSNVSRPLLAAAARPSMVAMTGGGPWNATTNS